MKCRTCGIETHQFIYTNGKDNIAIVHCTNKKCEFYPIHYVLMNGNLIQASLNFTGGKKRYHLIIESSKSSIYDLNAQCLLSIPISLKIHSYTPKDLINKLRKYMVFS